MKTKNILKLGLSISLTLILLYLFSKYINLEDLKNAFLILPITTLIFSLISYIVVYSFRTLRFNILMDRKGFFDMFSAVSIHNMMNGILPFRTGELSFIYIMGKRGEKKTKAFAAIMVARFFDVVSVFLIFLITLIITGTKEKSFFIATLLILIILILGIITFIMSQKYFIRLKGLFKFKLYQKSINVIQDTLSYIKKIKPFDLIKILIHSIMIWLFNYSIGFMIIRSLGINIDIISAGVALSFTTLIAIIPIQGFMNFGTLEAGWTIALVFFGVNEDLAISSGFVFHIINILMFSILGLIALFFENKNIKIKSKKIKKIESF